MVLGTPMLTLTYTRPKDICIIPATGLTDTLRQPGERLTVCVSRSPPPLTGQRWISWIMVHELDRCGSDPNASSQLPQPPQPNWNRVIALASPNRWQMQILAKKWK